MMGASNASLLFEYSRTSSTDQLYETNSMTNSPIMNNSHMMTNSPMMNNSRMMTNSPMMSNFCMMTNSRMTNFDDQLSANQLWPTNSPSSKPTAQRFKSRSTNPRQLRWDVSPSSHVRICAKHTECPSLSL